MTISGDQAPVFMKSKMENNFQDSVSQDVWPFFFSFTKVPLGSNSPNFEVIYQILTRSGNIW